MSTEKGIYAWVHNWDSMLTGWRRLQYVQELAGRLKMEVLRTPMGYAAVDPFDNLLPPGTSPYLESMAMQPDYHDLFANPRIHTHILTTYTEQAYNESGDWSDIDLDLEYREYKALASLLRHYAHKRFILLPWETDNEPVNTANIGDFVEMTMQRVRGIQDAGASNVFSGVEFAHTSGLVMPRLAEIAPDFISYSAWEFTAPLVSDPDPGHLETAFHSKLFTIQDVTKYPTNRIMIGEIGYPPGAALEASRWVDMVTRVAEDKALSIVVYWNLLEDGNGYGAFDGAGAVRSIGRYWSIFNRGVL